MQVTAIQVIYMNGYSGWNVTSTAVVPVVGEFSQDLCYDVFIELENEDKDNCPTLYHIAGRKPVQQDNVITCMGEETGVMFVGLC